MDGKEPIKAVEMKGVSFSYYKGRPVISGLDLELSSGGRYVLLGPNGGGKTTLLKLIVGLLRPSPGEVRIHGERMDPKKGAFGMGVSMLFQDPGDQFVMPTVLEDVCYGPLNLGLSPSEARAEARRALSQVGLKDFDKRKLSSLSCGEKRRVALAGVLVLKPRVLLLDEPTSDLDARGRRAVITTLRGLDCTILSATHDIASAPLVATDAFLLDRKLIGKGPLKLIMKDADLLNKAGLEPPPAMGQTSGRPWTKGTSVPKEPRSSRNGNSTVNEI